MALQPSFTCVFLSSLFASICAASNLEITPSDAVRLVSACAADTCCAEQACPCCCTYEPLRLLPTGPLGIDVHGWIDVGFTYNADHPPSNYNGPLTFNDRDDEFQVNQVYVVAEKPIYRDCPGWQIGGRADMVFGTDGRFTKAVGLELGQDGFPELNRGRRFYHLAFPQLYAEVARGNLSAKIGHFYTIIGYETVPADGNFFYSHAYTMQYGEPFTHTGLLVSYKLSDQLDLTVGLHNGWDVWDRTNFPEGNQWGVIGGFLWTSCDERTTLSAAFTWGQEPSAAPNRIDPFGSDGFSDRTMYSVVASRKFNDCWEYVIQHDLGWQLDGVAQTVSGEWYGINQYLYRTINERWKLGIRFEWFRDDDGIRITGLGDGNPIFGAGFAGDFYGATVGANWTPHPNVRIRPEIRWDWFVPGRFEFERPFDDGAENDMFTMAIDAIILW